MIKYYLNIASGGITASDAFAEASASELRVLLALIEAGGAVESDSALAELASVSRPRVASALALWEEAGVISKDDEFLGSVSDDFGAAGRVSRSSEVAKSLRDEALAATIAECAAIMELPTLGTEAAKDIHYLYIDLDLSAEYIVTLASFVYGKYKDRTRRHSYVMNYFTMKMKSEAERLIKRGITTVEELEIDFKRRSEESGAISEFRLATSNYSNLGKTQTEAIRRWFYEYGYSPEVVALAYDIATQKSTNGQWYRLTAKIIENWHESGCKTVEDCKAEGEAFKKGGKKPRAKATEDASPKYGDFNSEDALMKALLRSYGNTDGKE